MTPTLGRSPWLPETVRSVAELPFPVRHVLVAPPAEVARLRNSFPNVTVAEETGGGMYAAINRGAAAIDDWDLLTYINDDDSLLPGFRSVALCASKNAHLPFLAYGRVRLIDASGRRIGTIPVSPLPSINRALYAQRIEPMSQQGSLVTRTAWEKLGGYDTSWKLCGDSDFLARACVAGVRFRFVNRTVGTFRLRAGQLTKSRGQMLEERERIDRNLELLAPKRAPRYLLARGVFRLYNASAYIERVVRHGFHSYLDVVNRFD